MGAFLNLLQAALGALSTTMDRKISQNRGVGSDWKIFLHRLTQVPVLLALVACGAIGFLPSFNFREDLVRNALLLAVSMALLYATYPLRRLAYMNEKVTVLQPFADVKSALSVIVAYLFIPAERSSAWALAFSLLAVGVVVLSETRGKGLKFNRWSLTLLASTCILTVQSFFTLNFIKLMGGVGYFALEAHVVLAITGAALLLKGKWRSEAPGVTRRWAGLVSANSLVAMAAGMIVMASYERNGMVFTSLIQLLYLVFLFAFSALVLGERPTAKNVVVSAAVSACVACGMLL